MYHKQKEIVGESLKNEIVFSCHTERERVPFKYINSLFFSLSLYGRKMPENPYWLRSF